MSDALWGLEERLWLEGASAYRELLHPECLMAFPGVGILSAEAVLESLKDAPRWRSVQMDLRKVARAGRDIAVLAYRAEAVRDGSAPFRCVCTSSYLHEQGRWRIVQHQQTPAADAAL